ncbi:MAG: GntR family transcriptional regulator [Sphaerochaeta sp.]
MARPKSDSTKIAFNTIKDRINKFDLLPGDTVSDLQLSQELNMSRTPIREAIVLLMQCNLVKKEKHKYVVKHITKKDIKELLAIRVSLESLAAKLIIEKGGLTEKQLVELNDLENKYLYSMEANNYIDNFKYDAMFHKTIVNCAENSRLSVIMNNISIQSERLRWLSILTPIRLENAKNEHGAILNSLKKRDVENTCSVIEEHLFQTIKNYNSITENDSLESIITSFKKAFQ